LALHLGRALHLHSRLALHLGRALHFGLALHLRLLKLRLRCGLVELRLRLTVRLRRVGLRRVGP
jgi:hypothetical protein